MSKGNRRIVIVDAFAGPGRYLGGEEGSRLILLDAYLNHYYRRHMTSEIVYLFIGERRDSGAVSPRFRHPTVELALDAA